MNKEDGCAYDATHQKHTYIIDELFETFAHETLPLTIRDSRLYILPFPTTDSSAFEKKNRR
jgi:hypothetical protein